MSQIFPRIAYFNKKTGMSPSKKTKLNRQILKLVEKQIQATFDRSTYFSEQLEYMEYLIKFTDLISFQLTI